MGCTLILEEVEATTEVSAVGATREDSAVAMDTGE